MSDSIVIDNEISLSDILSKLWESRGIIIVAPILAVLFALLYLASSALTVHHPVSYVINLKGIENRQYPNGAAFSPQDLLVPEVLSEVRRRFNLPADARLRDAISATFDSLVADGISKNYRDRLEARNLSQAEISAINEAYLNALRDAMRSSLRISIDYRTLGVDGDLGLAIARALPEIWTSVFTTQFRIFTDPTLADVTVSQDAEDLKSTSSVLAANARIATMKRGIQTLIEDNRLSMFQTADGGSAATLGEELRRIETIFFDPIKSGSIRNDDPIAHSYLSRLQLEIADKRRQVAAYDEALKELRMFQGAGPGIQSTGQATTSERNTLQLGETAFAEIVQMVGRATYADFVQETLAKRNELMFEISTLMKDVDISTRQADFVLPSEFRAQAAKALEEFTKKYSDLTAAVRTQLRTRSGELYEPALGPLIQGSFISSRSLLILATAGFAGGLFAILFALLRGTLRNTPHRD